MYAVGLEPWSAKFWAECRALAEDHFEEVDGGIDPRRRFKLDEQLMAVIDQAGPLKIIAGRADGKLVGYYTWNVLPDVESEGLLTANQGAWYVAPGHPRLAFLMFVEAVRVLKQCGVQCIFPHHRTQGRGANLGRFFKRRGAKHIQETYFLWIGD